MLDRKLHETVKRVFSLIIFLVPLILSAQVPSNDSPCITGPNPPIDLTGGGTHTGTTCEATFDLVNAECSAQTENASVWYIYTPDENDDGYDITLEDAGANGPISLEYYIGLPNGGCTDSLTLLGSSCNSNTAYLKLGNCFESGEVLFVKVTSEDTEDACGEFVLSIVPASCEEVSDNCFDTALLDPLTPITSMDPFSDIYPSCANSCIDYACPEDDNLGGCPEFTQAPTVWVQVETDENAAQMFTTVSTDGNWTPIWSVWSGTSCDDLEIVNYGGAPACSDGDHTPEIHQVAVLDGISNYWIAVTADPFSIENGIDDGSFELCVATEVNALICLGEDIGDCNDPSLVIEVTDREVENKSLNGPFCQGEEVTIHVSFEYDAIESGADWLSGMVPIFGEGWDLTNFDFSSNAPIGNGMTAQWYEEGSDTAPIIQEAVPILCTFVNADGDLTLCNKLCSPCSDCPELGMEPGDPLPSGYFWVTNGGNAGCENDGSPGEGWGIGSTQASISWDFTLKVKEFDNSEDCYDMKDLSISFQTFSDGVVGCWEDPVGECILDRAMFGPAWEVECNLPTKVIGENADLCVSGVLEIPVATEDGSSTEVIVTPIPNENISGANAYNFINGFGLITDELTNLSNEEQIQQYILSTVNDLNACNSSQTVIDVTISTMFDADLLEEYNCIDDCATLSLDINGCGVAPFEYLWSTGELSETIIVCPDEATLFSVTVTDSLEETIILETNVESNPILEISLPETIQVCKDDDYNPFNPDYIVCLDIVNGSPAYTIDWQSDPGLVGEPSGFMGECFAINEVLSSVFINSGVYTLRANVTDQLGCVGNAEVDVKISGEITLILDVSPYDCEETKVSINATALTATGTPVNTFLLYGGCPDEQLGDFLDEYYSQTGTVTIDNLNLLNYTCYTIVAQSDEGCQVWEDINIPFLEEVPIEIEFNSDVCEGSLALISIVNHEDYQSYEWSPDIGQSNSLSIIPDSTQTYTVTATSFDGCVSTQSITITVHPLESTYCTDPCVGQDAEFQITGTAYSDINENGIYDSGDFPLSNVYITDNSTGFVTFTNILGDYVIPVEAGLNTLTASISFGEWEASDVTIGNIDVMQPCTEGINFPFISEGSLPGAEISVTNSITRCAWETRFYVTVENIDHTSINSEVVFTFDDKTTYFSSDIPGIQVVGNQIKFQTGIILPFHQNTYIFKLLMPNGTALLPILDFKAELFDEGELADVYEYSEQLRCSYDPNDKRTNPDRAGDENLTLVDERIDYTIRFQNNGNDTAFHVRIVDVLDPFVDQNSIRFSSSSHPYYACLMKDTLILDFFDIRLVDSMTNYPGSQGFVNFSLKVDSIIPEGTVVKNTADIIFDVNEPIVTNTVVNTMVYDFCTDPVTDLAATICLGEEYLGYTETGIYQDTIITEEGCDSLVNIDLDVITPENIDLEYTICEGEEVEYEGTPYSFETSGLYTIEIGGLTGCIEKVLNFNMNVIPIEYIDEEVVTICDGESYEGLDVTGIYTIEELDPNNNCPVIRTINLTVVSIEDVNLEYVICEGEGVEYEGLTYSFESSGLYTIEIGGTSGCTEELLNFNIEVIETIFLETEQVTICEDENFEGLDSTGVYTFDLVDPDTGCPVVRTVDLTVLPLTAEECMVSTTTISKNNIRIYPIPTVDKVYVESDYTISGIRLYSAAGIMIYRSQIDNQRNIEMEVGHYPTGLYFIHIETSNGRFIEKIVVN